MTGHDLIRLNLPSDLRYLSILGACIQEMLSQVEISDREMTVYAIQLAAHEGCTNIIDHAYAGGAGRIKITLSMLPRPRRFVCEIHDVGANSFDPTTIEKPGEIDERGRGLTLICTLMDRVAYRSREGQVWQSVAGSPWNLLRQSAGRLSSNGNYWRMVKHL
jgi:serine/threonine-protein kinase RsbW